MKLARIIFISFLLGVSIGVVIMMLYDGTDSGNEPNIVELRPPSSYNDDNELNNLPPPRDYTDIYQPNPNWVNYFEGLDVTQTEAIIQKAEQYYNKIKTYHNTYSESGWKEHIVNLNRIQNPNQRVKDLRYHYNTYYKMYRGSPNRNLYIFRAFHPIKDGETMITILRVYVRYGIPEDWVRTFNPDCFDSYDNLIVGRTLELYQKGKHQTN